MSDETNDVTMHGYPPIPSEIPTTKDGWRQRAIGLKLRLSAAESQNQALQERAESAELAWTAANDRLAALTRVDHLDASNNGTIPVLQEALQRIASMSPSTDNAGWLAAVTIARDALSPTQETDPG